MTLHSFRRLVRREFGSDLANMTPANAREFLNRVQPQIEGANGARVRLNEPERTYEGIQRDFLRLALDSTPEQAVIHLWLYCLEMAAEGVVDLETERLERLFAVAGADSE